MKEIKNLYKKHKTYFIVFFVFFIIIILGLYKCPLKYLFGIPCPMCGMTRAILSLLSFDYKKAFYFHALWPAVIIEIPLYIIIRIKKIYIKRKYQNIIMIFTTFLFIAYFIIRHITGSLIVKINFYNSLIYRLIKYFI